MDRLPFDICKPYYDALGINFKDVNPAQYEVAKNQDRFPVIIGGERGGKSFVTAAILLCHMLVAPLLKPEKYASRTLRHYSPDFTLFGPNYREPKVEFEYIEGWLRQLNMLWGEPQKPQKDHWRLITKDKVVLTTWSTEVPKSIRAIDLEGAVACEAGAMEYDAIERIRGRVSSNHGFILYNGTMENTMPWYVKWALEGKRDNRYGIRTYSLPSWSNTLAFPGGRQDPEILSMEESYLHETWMTRICAEPMPPRDRVLREIKEEHIKDIPLPRDENGQLECQIELWIDPGYLPSAYAVLWVAIWDTEEGKMFYVFDEIYEQEIDTLAIIDMIMMNKYWKYVDKYGIVIDVSAKRHADGNEPSVEIYRKKTGKVPYTHYWHENALMERIRVTANEGHLFINPDCKGLIAESGLGDYPKFPEMHHWRYPSNKDGNIINDKPEDKWNHSCKALGYGLLRHLGIVERKGPAPSSWNRIRDKDRERKTPKKSYMVRN